MKPVRIFRHEDWVHAGRLTQFLNARSIPWALVRIDQGEPYPRPSTTWRASRFSAAR
jgi:hypothetical protein